MAWAPLGWEALAFCEIDDFPSAVLAYHYPDVPNLGDITKVDWKKVIEEHGRPDVVVGGSPCQSFSIAGGRESLRGESRLMFEYIRALAEIRPKWFLWENVPGVLNTRDDAFTQLLREVQDIGYLSLAWRVLDAQFFGVAQRRRRVFLVGHLGEGGSAAAVLFEPESVRGDNPSSKQKREELARAAGRGSGARGSAGFCGYASHTASSIGYQEEQAPTLKGNDWQCQVPDVLQATAIRTANTSANGCGISEELAHTIDCAQPEAVAFAQNTRDEVRIVGGDGSYVGALAASPVAKQQSYVCQPLCMADDTQNAAIDENLSGTLKVGGGYADGSVCNSNGDEIVGALCAADGTKGVGSQYFYQGKVICQRVTKDPSC